MEVADGCGVAQLRRPTTGWRAEWPATRERARRREEDAGDDRRRQQTGASERALACAGLAAGDKNDTSADKVAISGGHLTAASGGGGSIESERGAALPAARAGQGRRKSGELSAVGQQESGAESARRRVAQQHCAGPGEAAAVAAKLSGGELRASCRATSELRAGRTMRVGGGRDIELDAAAQRAGGGIEVGEAARGVKLSESENENEIEIDDRRRLWLTSGAANAQQPRQQSQSTPHERAADSLGRPARDANASTFSLSFYDYDHEHEREHEHEDEHEHQELETTTSATTEPTESTLAFSSGAVRARDGGSELWLDSNECTIVSGVELAPRESARENPSPSSGFRAMTTTTEAKQKRTTQSTTTTLTLNKTTMSQLAGDDHLRAAVGKFAAERRQTPAAHQFEAIETELENHKGCLVASQPPLAQSNGAGHRISDNNGSKQHPQQQQLNLQPPSQTQQQNPDQQQQQQQPLQRQYPPNHPLGNSKHLCSICGDRATGKHYGVYSCEGCKGFFKRTIRKDIVYVCRAQGECVIDMRQRNRCQYCRYQKCLARGMKREAVQEEKQRLKLRAASANSAVQQQQQHLNYRIQHHQTQLVDLNNNTNSSRQVTTTTGNQCDTSDNQFPRVESTTNSGGGAATEATIMFGPGGEYTYQQHHFDHNHRLHQHHQNHHQDHLQQHHNQAAAAADLQQMQISPASSSVTPTSYHAHSGCRPAGAHHQSPLTPTATATSPLEPQQFSSAPLFSPAQRFSGAGSLGPTLSPPSTLIGGGQLGRHGPHERLDALTLKWAAQVQIERLIDWAKSVPKFRELLIDDQVTLLSAYWNELIIADIAFRSAECLRDGSLPQSPCKSHGGPPIDSLCIGRGLFVDEQQAHELGFGTMFERIINELVAKMYDMRLDSNELACLRAIVLFNPETHGLKTSQPIEEYRGDIYTTLEAYCRRHYENQPNRFGKLLLRLPVLRSIGLKCDSVRSVEPAATSQLVSTTTTSTSASISTAVATPGPAGAAALADGYPAQGGPFLGQTDTSVASPASSGSSSVNSNCSNSITSTSAGLVVSSTPAAATVASGQQSGAHKFGLQVKLLFFDLCYQSMAVDVFLRSTLSLH